MRVLVIIRTFPKDDFITKLCHDSFKNIMDCDILFFAEKGEYKWININAAILRDSCSNFGGQAGLYNCVDNLKYLDVEKYDKIILSDSDITMLKNPLDYDFDFGGIQSATHNWHYSGQLLIYSKWLWDKVMGYEKYDRLIDIFVKSGTIDVADDTCMSWVATDYTDNVFDFSGLEYWRHEKLHHLEPLFK